MSRARLLAGWIVVVLIAGLVSVSTLLVVREAVGGGTVVDALSQADVAAQYVIAQSHASAGSAPSEPTSPGPSSSHPARSGTAPRASAPAARPTPSATVPGGAGARPLSGAATGAGSSSSGSTSVTRVLTTSGGSVVVRCTGSGSSEGSGSVYLVSWSPAQGYGVDHARRGPGEEAEIEFESSANSVSVSFRCNPSGPVQSVEKDDGWGDGGGDGGGED